MSTKLFGAGVAAAAAVGVIAAGITSMASGQPAAVRVQPVGVGAPLPTDPPATPAPMDPVPVSLTPDAPPAPDQPTTAGRPPSS